MKYAPVTWPSTFRKAGKPSSCSPTTKPYAQQMGRGCQQHISTYAVELLRMGMTHQGCQHGDAAVRDLRLAPALDLLHRPHAAVGAADQVSRVEDVLERRADAGQGLHICTFQGRRR